MENEIEMTEKESEFFDDIQKVMDEYNATYECHHVDGYFTVEATVNSDTWTYKNDEIWSDLVDLGRVWGVSLDDGSGTYAMSIPV